MLLHVMLVYASNILMFSVVPVILEVRKSRPRGDEEFVHSG